MPGSTPVASCQPTNFPPTVSPPCLLHTTSIIILEHITYLDRHILHPTAFIYDISLLITCITGKNVLVTLTIVLDPKTKIYGYTTSEKKKSLFIGGGPGTNPLGISTISPDKSAQP